MKSLKHRFVLLLRSLVYGSVTAGIIVFIAFQYIESPKEKLLSQENSDLRNNYSLLQDRML